MKRGFGGWLILVAALAVPSLLFYNWWAKQSEAQRAELQRKVKNRLPPGTPMFGAQPPQNKLDNPLDRVQPSTAATAAVAGVAPSTATAAVATIQPPAAEPTASPSPSPSQAPAPPETQPAAQGIAASDAASASPAPVAVDVDTGATLSRDPTLSPYDVVRIEQKKLEDELRKSELHAGAPKRKVPRHIEHPVENDIDLQGIVSADDGDKAIINGEMVAEGELVKGAKVVKITSQTVVFMYRGRRFSKTITK